MTVAHLALPVIRYYVRSSLTVEQWLQKFLTRPRWNLRDMDKLWVGYMVTHDIGGVRYGSSTYQDRKERGALGGCSLAVLGYPGQAENFQLLLT
jgi:hypothetical protein